MAKKVLKSATVLPQNSSNLLRMAVGWLWGTYRMAIDNHNPYPITVTLNPYPRNVVTALCDDLFSTAGICNHLISFAIRCR